MRADPDRLASDVYVIAHDLLPRDYPNVENLGRVAEHIGSRFEETHARVEEQPFSAAGRTYRNVCARLGPERGARVVVGAHYDAAGPYPGADDNASGVAGLIELAHIFSDNEPDYPVELVAFCLEEPPFFFTKEMGSYVHAASLRRHGAAVSFMMSLEMIGYFTDDPGSQRFPSSLLKPFYPSEGNFIAVVGKLFDRVLVRFVRDAMRSGSPLPVRSLNAPRIVPGVALSDHLSYWRCGFPAVMITDTAMYRNPNYHRPSDRPETLDYNRMAMVVDGVAAVVRAVGRRRRAQSASNPGDSG